MPEADHEGDRDGAALKTALLSAAVELRDEGRRWRAGPDVERTDSLEAIPKVV